MSRSLPLRFIPVKLFLRPAAFFSVLLCSGLFCWAFGRSAEIAEDGSGGGDLFFRRWRFHACQAYSGWVMVVKSWHQPSISLVNALGASLLSMTWDQSRGAINGFAVAIAGPHPSLALGRFAVDTGSPVAARKLSTAWEGLGSMGYGEECAIAA